MYAGQAATVSPWKNGLVPNCERSMSMLNIVTLLFNLYSEYITQISGLDETQAGIKIAGRNINNLRYADDTTHMAESKEELKSLLMKMKEESEKACLKLNFQKTKIVASGPTTSWQTGGETMETGQILFSWAPKSLQILTAPMKLRCFLLGRKALTNLNNI